MNEIKIFNDCPLTKSGQAELANRLVRPVIEGEVDPLESVVKAKSLVEALTKFLGDDRIKDCTLSEIEKEGKESTRLGARVAVKEVGVKYDYSNCEDPIYRELTEQKAALEKKIKERESFLKHLTERTTIVDEATGEVLTLLPPVRMGSTGYTITFQK